MEPEILINRETADATAAALADTPEREIRTAAEALREQWKRLQDWMRDNELGAEGFPVEEGADPVKADIDAQTAAAVDLYSRMTGTIEALREAGNHGDVMAAIRENAAPELPEARERGNPRVIGIRDRLSDAPFGVRAMRVMESAMPGHISENSNEVVKVPLRGVTAESLFESGRQLRAAMTTANSAPDEVRLPGVTPAAYRDFPMTLLDYVMPVFDSAPGSVVEYVKETSAAAGPQAAEVAEGAATPEATFTYSEEIEHYREIAIEIPIGKLALRSAAHLRPSIERALPLEVMHRLNGQLVAGTGAAGPPPQIRGFRNIAGAQSEAIAVANERVNFAVAGMKRAKTKQMFSGGAGRMPLYVMNPGVWDEIITRQVDDDEGEFINGGLVNVRDGTVDRVPVIQHMGYQDAGASAAKKTGTAGNKMGALVDLGFSELHIQSGGDLTLEYGYSGPDFSNRQLRVQAVITCAFIVKRSVSIVELLVK